MIATAVDIDDILAKLECVKPTGPSQWMAQCPAHEDHSPSLSITIGHNRLPVFHCHAGCPSDQVVAALGFSFSDFHDGNANGNGSAPRARATRPPTKAKAEKKTTKTYPDLAAAVNAASFYTLRDHPAAIVTKYHYSETHTRLRLDWTDDGTPEKTFREISRRDDCQWILKKPSGKTPLYKAESLEKDTPVYVVEGEKACDAGLEIGLQCTTSGSSSSAPRADWSRLDGVKTVVIVPDHDRGGEKYAEQVASYICALKHPPTVKIVLLPDLPKKGDIVEYIETQRSAGSDDAEIKAAIEELVDDSDVFEPEADAETEPVSTAAPAETEDVATDSDPRYHCTDTGNAERLVHQFGNVLRFTSATGWLHWNGTHWERDDTAAVARLARQSVRTLYDHAARIEDTDTRVKQSKFAVSCESSRRLKDMTTLAESMHPIRISADDLDKDPWLLNVENGTLDLRTGTMRPHKQADLITRCCPVRFDPAATAPRFRAFIGEIMDCNVGMMDFLQRAMGYSITADTSERVFFLAHGGGCNGKSTFLNVIREIVGPYSLETPTETLMAKHNEGIPNDVARLNGRRLVTASETTEHQRLNTGLVKKLTGGTDVIAARFLRREYFEFKPVLKLWLSCNHKPVVNDTSDSIWDRVRLIPFTVRIAQEDVDKQLPQKLRAEGPGILNWLLEGVREWRAHGLNPPGAVTDAGAEYRCESDLLAEWIADCCEIGNDLIEALGDLYSAYVSWCNDGGIKRPITRKRFGISLHERGFEPKQTGVRKYVGIALKYRPLPGGET